MHSVCTKEDLSKDKDSALAGWMEKADSLNVRKYVHLAVEADCATNIGESPKGMAVLQYLIPLILVHFIGIRTGEAKVY